LQADLRCLGPNRRSRWLQLAAADQRPTSRWAHRPRGTPCFADNKLVGYQAQLQGPESSRRCSGPSSIQPVKAGCGGSRKDKTQLANGPWRRLFRPQSSRDGTYGQIPGPPGKNLRRRDAPGPRSIRWAREQPAHLSRILTKLVALGDNPGRCAAASQERHGGWFAGDRPCWVRVLVGGGDPVHQTRASTGRRSRGGYPSSTVSVLQRYNRGHPPSSTRLRDGGGASCWVWCSRCSASRPAGRPGARPGCYIWFFPRHRRCWCRCCSGGFASALFPTDSGSASPGGPMLVRPSTPNLVVPLFAARRGARPRASTRPPTWPRSSRRRG